MILILVQNSNNRNDSNESMKVDNNKFLVAFVSALNVLLSVASGWIKNFYINLKDRFSMVKIFYV